MPPYESAAAPWTILIPVKQIDVAKSRLLGLTDVQRRDLAMAFALDTIAAALACLEVNSVVVITNHPDHTPFHDVGADVVADVPDAGLNSAVVHGEYVVRLAAPDAAVAALAGDLPTLRPGNLSTAFAAAAHTGSWFVADLAGTGTTMLAAAGGQRLKPEFGPHSRAAHSAAGADEVIITGIERLRRDVDTASDLRDAVRLGVGKHTGKVLATLARGLA